MAPKPVVRSDGKSYASMSDACRDLQEEIGLQTPVSHMVSNIYAVCHGRQASAYGYGWQYGAEWHGEKWSKKPRNVRGKGKAKTKKELQLENEALRLLAHDLCRMLKSGSAEEARRIYQTRHISGRIAMLGVLP